MTAAAAIITLVLAARPAVTSDSDCPSGPDVARQLAMLLPDDAAEGTVDVTAGPDAVDVELWPRPATAGTRREVAVVGSCHERASAVAVVVATWWPAGSDRPHLTAADGPTAPTQLRAREHELALAPAAFVSLGSFGAVPGARIAGLWWGLPVRLAPRLALGVAGPYGGALGRGEARFVRATVEAGLAYGGRRITVDASLLGSAAWIRGSGYDANRATTGFAAGASAGIGVGWSFGGWAPWVGLRGIYWPQAQRIFVLDPATDGETSQSLPQVELQLEVGLAFSLL